MCLRRKKKIKSESRSVLPRRRRIGRTIRLWLGPVAAASYWVARMLKDFAGFTWRKALEWLDRMM